MLVVGASASGVQIADEVHRSGRTVTLAVGDHVRVPRRYRGQDILWWLDARGILDERRHEMDDLVRARNLASLQLVGAPTTLDLNALQARRLRWSASSPPSATASPSSRLAARTSARWPT